MKKKNVQRLALYLTLATLLLAGCAKKATEPIAAEPIAPVTPVAAEPATDTSGNKERVVVEVPVPEVAARPDAEPELQRIYFDFDRYLLTPQAREILARNAAYLKSRPEIRVVIDGYCDERGADEYNLALGEKRAHAARNFLVSLGVPQEALSTISYGEEKPLDSGHHEEAWAKNRRAEFQVVPLPAALSQSQPQPASAGG